ncbi:hypothetical protein OIG52_002451 [Salmonella enterica]|nr:hypothetical protein [Salmonella enterica]EDY7799377.1 hypothetical protein [Salmonella enterica]EEP0619685.1 hypothetical protein [Salmonella enterica]EGB3996179.1 hypothetical protein [Salmonella enterica]EGF8522887.1 hypothetical protein [Salmonella enterica]
MTTNHPAHGPVSLERLHQIREILSKAAAQSDGGNLGYAMADAVKVIDGAIASFGAEPVAWKAGSRAFVTRVVAEMYACEIMAEIQPLYTTPPATVVPEGMRMALSNAGIAAPESDEMLAATHEKYIQALVTLVKDRKPFQPAQLVPEEVSWEDVPEEITEDNMEVALAWAHGFNHCRTAMLQAGNSPVTPDGWQLVPKEPTEAMNKAGWAAMNEHDAINPTYRAMLAAAPQQEVKSALEHGMQRYAGAMQKLSEGDK